MGTLTLSYNRQRQAAIDEELFDLIAGYEVLAASEGNRSARDGESSAKKARHTQAGGGINMTGNRTSKTT
jgi:hypothetical protein